MLETRKKTYSRRSIIAAKPITTTTRTEDDDVSVVSETMRKRRGRRNKEEDYRDELPLPDGKKDKKNNNAEEEERRMKKEIGKKRLVFVLFLFCLSVSVILLISYLRLLIVPDAVRTKAMEHTQFLFPSWMGVNETFLNLLPALNPDVLNSNSYYNATEHLVAARQVSELLNARPKHPVVIVPGFVNTGLELWKSKPCIAKRTQFRQRMWGTPAMAKAFFITGRVGWNTWDWTRRRGKIQTESS